MPEYPITESISVKTFKKVKRKSVIKITINPDANVSRLKKAIKDQDEIGGALQLPQDNKDWLNRFGSSQPLDSSPGMINYRVRDEDDRKPDLLMYEFNEDNFSISAEAKEVKKQRLKCQTGKVINSDESSQPPLFQFFESLDNSE